MRNQHIGQNVEMLIEKLRDKHAYLTGHVILSSKLDCIICHCDSATPLYYHCFLLINLAIFS